jgi:hypothetical protein
MDRRRFLLTSLTGVLAAPLGAEAQQPGKIARIGFLSLAAGPTPSMDLSAGLRGSAGSRDKTSSLSTAGRQAGKTDFLRWRRN